jgi:TolA-binding protein
MLLRNVLPVVLIVGVLAATSARADDKDDQIKALQEQNATLTNRVDQLEKRLAALEQRGQSAASKDEARQALVLKARQRMAADSAKHSRDDLRAAEELYQIANKDWRSDAAKNALTSMVSQYPDMNRTGCAVLYLGQMSEGNQREQYLKDAVEKFSDCWYGDGVQVGGFARLLLGDYYRQQKQPEKAKAMFDEIRKDYATAINHDGSLIVDTIPKE